MKKFTVGMLVLMLLGVVVNFASHSPLSSTTSSLAYDEPIGPHATQQLVVTAYDEPIGPHANVLTNG